MKLWQHQTDALDLIRKQAGNVRRIVLGNPCGSGKTEICAELLRAATAKSRTGLILTHRRDLVFQTHARFTSRGLSAGVIMGSEPQHPWRPVQVASIQTLTKRGLTPECDFLIVDEAHLFTSQQREKIIKHYEDKITILISATPIDGFGRGLGKSADVIVQTAYHQQLEREGILVGCKVYVPNRVDMTGAATSNGEWNAEESGRRVKPIIGDVFKNWERLAYGLPTIVFAPTVHISEQIAKDFEAQGVRAVHMDAHTPKEERSDVLMAHQRGQIKVVCNVGLFREGSDFPWVHCAVNVCPMRSLRLWRQSMGRTLRCHPSKKHAIIIDHTGSAYQHGPPNKDFHWWLDASRKRITRERKRQESNEQKTIVCPKCHLARLGGRECPGCGFVPKTTVQYSQATLVNMSAGSQEQQIRDMMDRKNWKQQIYRAANAKFNMTVTQAMACFKRENGHWPANHVHKVPEHLMQVPVKLCRDELLQRLGS